MEENKKRVKKALKDKKVDLAIITNWPFIGSFLEFLKEQDIMKYLTMIKSTRKRKILDHYIFILLYIIKLIIGIPTIRGSEALLGDMGAMKLIGFNMDQLANGLCNRGDANQHGRDYKKNHLL